MVIDLEDIATLDLLVSDARVEDESMVGAVLRADLAHIAEVLEDQPDGAKDRCDGLAALVGLERDGAAEHDVGSEQLHGWVRVSCLDGGAERMHDLTSD
jgi:hypothetical protein